MVGQDYAADAMLMGQLDIFDALNSLQYDGQFGDALPREHRQCQDDRNIEFRTRANLNTERTLSHGTTSHPRFSS